MKGLTCGSLCHMAMLKLRIQKDFIRLKYFNESYTLLT